MEVVEHVRHQTYVYMDDEGGALYGWSIFKTYTKII